MSESRSSLDGKDSTNWWLAARPSGAGRSLADAVELMRSQGSLAGLTQRLDTRSMWENFPPKYNTGQVVSRALEQMRSQRGLAGLVERIDARSMWADFLPQYNTGQMMMDALEQMRSQGSLVKLAQQVSSQSVSAALVAQLKENKWAVIEELKFDVLRQVDDSRIQELVEDLDNRSDEDDYERVGELEDFARDDPFLEACLERMARATVWVQQRFPLYSDKARRGFERVAAASLSFYIRSILPTLLFTNFGVAGLAIGSLAAGTAVVFDEKQKSRLAPSAREALARECPTCAAPENVWCMTIRGNNPGTPASRLHVGRSS